jgi:DNA-binding NtrC family response regulator
MAKIKSTSKKGAAIPGQQLEYPIIGKSKVVQHLVRQIKRLAKGKEDVLIIGEAGVGKGAIGRNIHSEQTTGDPNVPLTSLNLAVIDDKELGAILFGYEQGAAGYPNTSKRGIIEATEGGTVLVEEIEEASLRNQMKILKFIKERQVKREGGTKKENVDVRLIITAKDNPEELSEKNKILKELADELSSFERIEVPPLREHPEDVPMLVEHFTQEACGELGIEEPVIDINAIDVLVRQRWKENIRELKSVIDRSVLFSTGGMFTLPPELTDEKTEVVKMINNILTGQEFEINKSLDIIERGIVERALERFGFNQSKAAQFLGMTEQTLRYRLKRLGIVPSRSRGT